MQGSEKSIYSYLPYITLKEAWSECSSAFVGWLFISGVWIGVGVFGSWGASEMGLSIGGIAWRDVPNWTWYVAFASIVIWINRGEEVKIAFPPLTIWQWLGFTLFLTLFAATMTYSPWWIAVPFYLGIFLAWRALDDLGQLGKENYLKLHQSPEDGG